MEFVHEIENLVPNELCDEIISKYEKSPQGKKHKGQVGTGLISIVKQTTDMDIESEQNRDEWYEISQKLIMYLNKGLDEYEKYLRSFLGNKADLFMYKINGCRKSGFSIHHYKKGDYYDWHSDSSSGVNEDRVMAFIFYLNTLEENCGGSTDFYDGTRIKPVQGKLLFFPVSHCHLHCGQMVKDKDKYIINGFIYKIKNL